MLVDHMSAPLKKCNTTPLPTYAPSAPSPNYTCEPTDGEQTLQQSLSLSTPPPSSTYTKTSEKVVVTLFDQEKDAKMPTYGRLGLISGTVYLEDSGLVFQVVVKIEGKLESSYFAGGYNSVKLVNDCSTLWKKAGDDNTCPSLTPFSFVLPTTFDYGDCKPPLPPSYAYPNGPILIKSHYSINVYVERIRHPMVGFLTAMKHVVIPFNYYPRTRAHRPIIASPCFFSAVKTLPEEWYQAFSEMKTRSNSRIDSVYCHLFIPAALAYGLKDTIPFHVQLNGPLHSIKKYLSLPEHDTTSEHSQPTKRPLLQCASYSPPSVKVYLLRQLTIELGGTKTMRNTILAEGQSYEVPPAHTSCQSQEMVHLDWEGEVKCKDHISVGGFVAGNVAVKDFISLDVEPPKQKNMVSPFLSLHMTVPIRLVTDSYIEVTDYGHHI